MRGKLLLFVACWASLWTLNATGWSADQPLRPLWQIGTPDRNTTDLALGPNGYRQFRQDAAFWVGRSKARTDWPYVHPGPTDVWAGGRRHTFTVLFGLSSLPAPTETCRLRLVLVDTHSRVPPVLVVRLNGQTLWSRRLPRGGSDESVFGDPRRGVARTVSVVVPASALKLGVNQLDLETVEGSWLLYDAVVFEAPTSVQLAAPSDRSTFVLDASSPPVLFRGSDASSSEHTSPENAVQSPLRQLVSCSVVRFGPPVEAELVLTGLPGGAVRSRQRLEPGRQTLSVRVPAVSEPVQVTVEVRTDGQTAGRASLELKPVRHWVVYLLPHSHVDIGYTAVQTEVERNQWRFLEQAIEAAEKTSAFGPDATFRWNVEVLWAVDGYLRQATPEQRQRFVQAVQKGWVGLDALYGNELTALCRPAELYRLVDFAGRVSRLCGVKIDSAMITDVPGYTWGLTRVLCDAGVRYWSMAPNSRHRVGRTHVAWDDKPFWWVTPDGRGRVLCWVHGGGGYYRTFRGPDSLLKRLRQLQADGFPYDILIQRYCLGDNQGPGTELSELVRRWNAEHAYPRLVIATTHQAFAEFEKRYGEQLPEFRGDFTPYWEDGAASSARETALNRAAAERLVQAETLWALLQPGSTYPDDDFYSAWRNVVLYDEHTWGAYCSISQPESELTKAQWKIKQAFALDADRQSRRLLRRAVQKLDQGRRKASDVAARREQPVGQRAAAVLVFNTNSWTRTGLAVVPASVSVAGDRVVDADGHSVPSQRLSTGELVFLARDVPPLGGRLFRFTSGTPAPPAAESDQWAVVDGRSLKAPGVDVELDGRTGNVRVLKLGEVQTNLVRADSGGLNGYFYVPGRDPSQAQTSGPATVRPGERGPLVASLVVESDAPGCRRLSREVRVVAGLQRVEFLNRLDKRKVYDKESVHFGFPWNVPGGTVRLDVPLAVVRPNQDQLPGSCKNYFTVQRWVDVSNSQFGVTWATVDSPLVELGAIRVDVSSPFDPEAWVDQLPETQTLLAYVMNNYWETNYRAAQEGPTLFRFAVQAHTGPYDPVAAARFGLECSQPLVVVPLGREAAQRAPKLVASRLTVEPAQVVLLELKPARNGRGWVLRLQNVGDQPVDARLNWRAPQPRRVLKSDAFERPGQPLGGRLSLAPHEVVTVLAEF